MSIPNEKPWLIDAFEILEFGLVSLFIHSKAYKRFTLIALDNAVEIAMWNFLKYEKDITPPQNNFRELCNKVKANLPDTTEKVSFFRKVTYYHDQRNPIYHQGTTITDIQDEHLIKQCLIVIDLFELLFYEDYEDFVVQDKKMGLINAYLRLKGKLREVKADEELENQIKEIEDKIQSTIVSLPFTDWETDDLQNTTDTINEIYNSI